MFESNPILRLILQSIRFFHQYSSLSIALNVSLMGYPDFMMKLWSGRYNFSQRLKIQQKGSELPRLNSSKFFIYLSKAYWILKFWFLLPVENSHNYMFHNSQWGTPMWKGLGILVILVRGVNISQSVQGGKPIFLAIRVLFKVECREIKFTLSYCIGGLDRSGNWASPSSYMSTLKFLYREQWWRHILETGPVQLTGIILRP